MVRSGSATAKALTNITKRERESPLWQICDSCATSRINQLEHKKLIQDQPARAWGDCISSDLHGPLEPSFGDKHVYACNFCDHKTGLCAVYGMKDKTAESAEECLRAFMADTAQLGTIVCLLTDGGKEFLGELDAFCMEQRIEHRRSAAYYSDGNSRAERAWQTLWKSARTMMKHSQLPQKHWFSALRYAAYTWNRTPKRVGDERDGYKSKAMSTPHFEAYKVVPDLSQCRVWGCLATAYRPDAKQHRPNGKLSDRAYIGYNMGPSAHVRGWDVYVPSITSGYLQARHVRFDEERFYAGTGVLDPEAKSNYKYSHPSEYTDKNMGETQEVDEDPLPQSGVLDEDDADCVLPHSATAPPNEAELTQATDKQERCRTPGCNRKINHDGAHSNEVQNWDVPGVPSARTRKLYQCSTKETERAEKSASPQSNRHHYDTDGSTESESQWWIMFDCPEEGVHETKSKAAVRRLFEIAEDNDGIFAGFGRGPEAEARARADFAEMLDEGTVLLPPSALPVFLCLPCFFPVLRVCRSPVARTWLISRIRFPSCSRSHSNGSRTA